VTARVYRAPIETASRQSNNEEDEMPGTSEGLLATGERQAACLAQLQLLRQLERQRKSLDG
jgi:hypothetical protein